MTGCSGAWIGTDHVCLLYRDELFFERVHDCIPIMHQAQYDSWSNNATKTEQQICLQQSMWALAISASAQPISVGNLLYYDARRRLEELEAAGTSTQLLEVMQVQAWLLLAIYELVRVDFRRGWMSAGRAFRRIQLMRLHELDQVDGPLANQSPLSWVQKEERRRTFWLAYLLDRYVSLSNGSPATLSEEVMPRTLSKW